MKRIKTFDQLFESSGMHEKCEEFFRIANGTEELKQIETWYNLHPTRTGKIKVLMKQDGRRINNPGNPYFFKYGSQENGWRFEFISSGRSYGEKGDSDLISLLRTFIRDIIYKFAPEDFNRAEAREIVDDDSLIFSGILKTPGDIYTKIRTEKRSDIITDFSLIKGKSKLIDGLESKIGNIYTSGDTKYLSINLGNIRVGEIPQVIFDISGGVGHYGSGIQRVENNGAYITIIPKGEGKKTISSSKSPRGRHNKTIKISLGYDDIDTLVGEIESIIKKNIDEIVFYTAKNSGGYVENPILTIYAKDLLLGNIDDEKIDRGIEDLLDNHMKKNPLDMYLLDDQPKIKAGVLRRTGIKDYSSIGRKLKSGLI